MTDQKSPPETVQPLAVDSATADLFRRLADLAYSSEDFHEVYAALVNAAPDLVPGCDHASLMVRRGEQLVTAVASDDVAEQIDVLERELGQGPCLDAIECDASYFDTDISNDAQWPRLAERVLAETPVRGMAGCQLQVGDGGNGALNLFSDRPDGLTPGCIDKGMVLASFASVALVAAEARRAAATLRAGLQSNREIGKAVGLMMAFHKIDDAEAFDMLRKTSQDLNLKLAEVARQVVDHHNQVG